MFLVCNHADPGSGSDRKYPSHFGHTYPCAFTSSRYTTSPHFGHLSHNPSGADGSFFLIPVFSVPEQNCRLLNICFNFAIVKTSCLPGQVFCPTD